MKIADKSWNLKTLAHNKEHAKSMDCEHEYQLNIDASLNLLERFSRQFSHYVVERVTGFNSFVVRMQVGSGAMGTISTQLDKCANKFKRTRKHAACGRGKNILHRCANAP